MVSTTSNVIAAHTKSSNHREEIESSPLCGCFYCLETFPSSAIEDWVDWPEGTPEELELSAGTTALCPRCGIDSVIGSASGYPIDAEFLSAMRSYWFS
ncbi:hypothetical protein GCM10027430_26920 [Lysobacter tyrosinilyticus]